MQNLLTLKALYIKGFIVFEMALRARKVSGTFEKRAPGLKNETATRHVRLLSNVLSYFPLTSTVGRFATSKRNHPEKEVVFLFFVKKSLFFVDVFQHDFYCCIWD